MKNEHVKQTGTKHEHVFATIMGRLRLALGLATDADVSRALGISTSNFSNRKASNSPPFEAIVNLCLERSISLDWVFSGKGGVFTNNESPALTNGFAPVDEVLLGEIMAELGYSQSPEFNPDKEGWKTDYGNSMKWVRDSFHGMIGATIYNKIGHLPKGTVRDAALHRETVSLGEGARIFDMQWESSRRLKED